MSSNIPTAANKLDSNNAAVGNILTQLIVLINSAVDDVVNSIVVRAGGSTTAVKSAAARFKATQFRASLDPAVTGAVNNLVDAGVDSVLTGVGSGSNNPVLTSLIASLINTLNGILNTDIDALLSALSNKFSNLSILKTKYSLKVNQSVTANRAAITAGIERVIESLGTQIATVTGQLNALGHSVSSSVEDVCMHIVNMCRAHLQSRKLTAVDPTVITGAVNSIVNNAVSEVSARWTRRFMSTRPQLATSTLL